MPSKNIVKYYSGDAYYHIYNRGVEKRHIFLEDSDYRYFLHLLQRHLSKQISQDNAGRLLPNYHDEITLLAFCLMPNHFHLFIWQQNPDSMTKLLRSVCTAYTMYFNKKYSRVGKLFQGVFKASMVTTAEYYQHISRYIHLNPKDPLTYEWSSIQYYFGKLNADWIDPSQILSQFSSSKEYKKFLLEYEQHKQYLDSIKYELANY